MRGYKQRRYFVTLNINASRPNLRRRTIIWCRYISTYHPEPQRQKSKLLKLMIDSSESKNCIYFSCIKIKKTLNFSTKRNCFFNKNLSLPFTHSREWWISGYNSHGEKNCNKDNITCLRVAEPASGPDLLDSCPGHEVPHQLPLSLVLE